ncbi:MAG TPA: TetR/AcrR family transcriptional regulator [Acetobacteraceae bacterium]|nr:TetR/AcrR family transcriptional regulator [Acetobacteraceae bacterium]
MSHHPEIRHDPDSPKRQAVIAAAGELFIAQGYGAVSMDAVARAAGVSKATLYAHFASKDRLFATIIKEACRQKVAAIDLLAEPCDDLAAALTALGQQMLRFLLDAKPLAIQRVVMAECVRFPELGRAFYENGPEVFRRTFGAWLAVQAGAGRLAVPDPVIAADQFLGMLRATGIFLRASLGLPPAPADADIDATVAAAVRTFLRAYAVE